jgi:hypothetical protein
MRGKFRGRAQGGLMEFNLLNFWKLQVHDFAFSILPYCFMVWSA